MLFIRTTTKPVNSSFLSFPVWTLFRSPSVTAIPNNTTPMNEECASQRRDGAERHLKPSPVYPARNRHQAQFCASLTQEERSRAILSFFSEKEPTVFLLTYLPD